MPPKMADEPEPMAFHLFRKLPLELRNMIWEKTLPGPRRLLHYCWHKGPIALEICRESRKVALSQYENICHDRDGRAVYINPEIDTVAEVPGPFVVGGEGTFPRGIVRVRDLPLDRTVLEFWVGGAPPIPRNSNNLVFRTDTITSDMDELSHREQNIILIHDMTGNNGEDIFQFNDNRGPNGLNNPVNRLASKMRVLVRWFQKAPSVVYSITEINESEGLDRSSPLPRRNQRGTFPGLIQKFNKDPIIVNEHALELSFDHKGDRCWAEFDWNYY